MSDPLTFPLLSTKCCKVLLGQNKMRTLVFFGGGFLCHHGDEQSLSLSGIKPFPLRAGVEAALLNQQRLINWFYSVIVHLSHSPAPVWILTALGFLGKH